MIEFRGVTKRYPDGTVAVDNLELQVRDGGITVFVGPSGCGKTTSLRMVNRMIDPTVGHDPGQRHGRDEDRRRRAAARHRLRHPAGGALPAPHDPRQHRHRAAAAGLEQEEGPRPRGRADGDRRAHPRDGAPLPGAALRRPAAARRRRPRARRGPAGAADGRAVQRGRPGGPREPAGRAAQAAGRAGQDDRVRHPRHRRGRQARRPGRGVPRRRQAGPVRRARRAARPPGRRLRRLLRRPRPRLPRPVVPLLGAAAAARAAHRPARASAPSEGWTLVLDADGRPLGWHHDRAGGGTRRREATSSPAGRCTTRAPARCAARWTRRCRRRPGRGSRWTATGGRSARSPRTTCWRRWPPPGAPRRPEARMGWVLGRTSR